MQAANAFEETTSFKINDFQALGVPAFIEEIDFLKELAQGEMEAQTIFEIKQTLRRLEVFVKTLRPEVTASNH